MISTSIPPPGLRRKTTPPADRSMRIVYCLFKNRHRCTRRAFPTKQLEPLTAERNETYSLGRIACDTEYAFCNCLSPCLVDDHACITNYFRQRRSVARHHRNIRGHSLDDWHPKAFKSRWEHKAVGKSQPGCVVFVGDVAEECD